MQMTLTTRAPKLSAFRFSLWWVNAAGVVILAATLIWAGAAEPFIGPIFLAFFLAYAVAATIIAAAVAPLLRRQISSIASSAHARLVLFGVLATSWVAAWFLGILVFGVVNLIYVGIEATTPGLSTDTHEGFGIFAGYWAWSAPILALYLVISAIVAARFNRKEQGL